MSICIDLTPYRGKRVCIALSGGGDSVALFHYFKRNAAKHAIELTALNVEHGIRGAASRADTTFVKELCAREKVPLSCFSEDVPARAKKWGIGEEEAARRCRYAIFVAVLAENRADLIVTAHHALDNAESVLLNLFRGASLTGAGGIRAFLPAEELVRQYLPEKKDVSPLYGKGIVRPFLGVGKAEIERYLRENRLQWREDESNGNTEYSRNFLRQKVLPSVKERFPRAEERLYDFSRAAREDDEFLYSLARGALEIGEECRIDESAPRPLFYRACVLALRHFGVEKDYSRANLEDIYALTSGENGKTIELPQALRAVRDYGSIVIYRFQSAQAQEYSFGAGEYDFGKYTVRILHGGSLGRGDGAGYRTLVLDASALPAGSVLRLRAKGDVFEKFGGGTKKLKAFLIDKKIPRRERDLLPVVACGGEVFAVCGVEISEKVMIRFGIGANVADGKNIYTILLTKKGESDKCIRT